MDVEGVVEVHRGGDVVVSLMLRLKLHSLLPHNTQSHPQHALPSAQIANFYVGGRNSALVLLEDGVVGGGAAVGLGAEEEVAADGVVLHVHYFYGGDDLSTRQPPKEVKQTVHLYLLVVELDKHDCAANVISRDHTLIKTAKSNSTITIIHGE